MRKDQDTPCPHTAMATALVERAGLLDLWALPTRMTWRWWRLHDALSSRTLWSGIGLLAGGIATCWLSAWLSVPLLATGLVVTAAEASWVLRRHATERRKERNAREEFATELSRCGAHKDLRAECIDSLSRFLETSAAVSRCGNWDKTLFSRSAADVAWRFESSFAQHLGRRHPLTQQMAEIGWFDSELSFLADHLDACLFDFTSPEPRLREWLERHSTCRPCFRVVIAALADTAANAAEARAARRSERQKQQAVWDERRKRWEAEADKRAREQPQWNSPRWVDTSAAIAEALAREQLRQAQSKFQGTLAGLAVLKKDCEVRGDFMQARYVTNHIEALMREYNNLH